MIMSYHMTHVTVTSDFGNLYFWMSSPALGLIPLDTRVSCWERHRPIDELPPTWWSEHRFRDLALTTRKVSEKRLFKFRVVFAAEKVCKSWFSRLVSFSQNDKCDDYFQEKFFCLGRSSQTWQSTYCKSDNIVILITEMKVALKTADFYSVWFWFSWFFILRQPLYWIEFKLSSLHLYFSALTWKFISQKVWNLAKKIGYFVGASNLIYDERSKSRPSGVTRVLVAVQIEHL